jgi:hypothetical protein
VSRISARESEFLLLARLGNLVAVGVEESEVADTEVVGSRARGGGDGMAI